jgi:hypothetical protein
MTKRNIYISILLGVLGIAIGIVIGIVIAKSNILLANVEELPSVSVNEPQVKRAHFSGALTSLEPTSNKEHMSTVAKLHSSLSHKLEPSKVKSEVKLALSMTPVDQPLDYDYSTRLSQTKVLDLTAQLNHAEWLDVMRVDGVNKLSLTKQLNEAKLLDLTQLEDLYKLNPTKLLAQAKLLELTQLEDLYKPGLTKQVSQAKLLDLLQLDHPYKQNLTTKLDPSAVLYLFNHCDQAKSESV